MGWNAMSCQLVVVVFLMIGTGLGCRPPNALTTVPQVTNPNEVRMLEIVIMKKH